MEETPTTAVLGFGNPVRSDDGVGCYVIEQLRHDPPAGASLFDMGTSAFEILFQLQGHRRLVVIDAAIHTGEPPGTVFRLPASEVEAAITDDPLVFLHSLKWHQGLSYARKILRENYPDDVQVYLIAVDDTRLDIGLSEAVQAAGDRVAGLVREKLAVQA